MLAPRLEAVDTLSAVFFGLFSVEGPGNFTQTCKSDRRAPCDEPHHRGKVVCYQHSTIELSLRWLRPVIPLPLFLLTSPLLGRLRL